jgi:hypothetical protein
MRISLKLQTKRKSFLIMVAIIFLILMVNIVTAGIWDDFLNLFSGEKTIADVTNDDVYEELVLNDAKNTEAIITIKNPMELVDIKRDDIKVDFIENCGHINSYKLLVNSTCEAERIKGYTYGTKEVCYNQSQIEKNCDLVCKNETIKICRNETFIKNTIYENYTYSCFKEFDKINAKDLRNIKIETNDIVWEKCSDGSFGYKIDWQIKTTLNDGINTKTLTKSDWEWWNYTYAYKMPLNCTNLDDYTPIVINGSNGFTINGKKQIIWTYCSGIGTAVYYNDELDIVVANDSTQLPSEAEFSNSSSYNPTSVWDANFVGVYHAVNGTVIKDSTNLYNSTNNTAKARTDGKIDGALELYNLKYVIIPTHDLGDQMTVEVWLNYTHTQAYQYVITKWEGATGNWLLCPWAGDTMNFAVNDGAEKDATSVAAYDDGAWHYAAGIANGTHVLIDVDGTLKVGAAYNGGISYTSDNSIYFNRPTSGTRFIGMIDEVRLSNIARSASYRTQVYQNALGTSGYGNLLAEEEAPISYILSGIVKDSSNIIVDNAKIIIINQADNTIIGTADSNSTGGWTYNLGIITGTFLVVAYDPANSTRDGDADPYIIVS